MSGGKVSKLSGFPEFLPAERNVELIVLDHLRTVFELHGFASIETRAVETMDQLLRKGEIDKEVYVLRRLQAGEGDSDSGMGLHFDLTVPFARYVLENAGKLEFPFRRYQIQKVWRGERPQQGRFREFTQADIDIIAKDALPFHFDVEIAQVMAEALSGLPVPQLTLQVSNRKVLEGFYLGLGIAEPTAVMPIVDKLDKVPADKIAELLQTDAGLTAEQAAQCLALADVRTTDASFVDEVRALGVSHPLLDEGLEELRQVVVGAAGADGVSIVADLRIARGLDYYTGTVFETRMAGYEHLGSICSGGRYDQLAQRRQEHLSRRRHLAGRLAPARPARRRRPHRRPLGAQHGPRRTGRRGVAPGQRRGRFGPPRARHPDRSGGQRAEVRQADSLRGTPGHTVCLVPRERRPTAPGQGHPRRRADRRRPDDLGTARRRPQASHPEHT